MISLKADRNYSDIDNEEAVNNVMILQNAMENNGFTGYQENGGTIQIWWNMKRLISNHDEA